MDYFKLFTLTPQIFANILSTVLIVEKQDLPGSEKLKLVIANVVSTIKLLPPDIQKTLHITDIEAYATEVTNLAVSVFNLAGIFTNKSSGATNIPKPAELTAAELNAQHIADIEKNLAHMKQRLADHESGKIPLPQNQVDNLNKRIESATKDLAVLKEIALGAG
jgi:hypothetical protein